jgi:hypothetical protein
MGKIAGPRELIRPEYRQQVDSRLFPHGLVCFTRVSYFYNLSFRSSATNEITFFFEKQTPTASLIPSVYICKMQIEGIAGEIR